MHAYQSDGAAASSLAALEAAELTPRNDQSPGVAAEGFRGQANSVERDYCGTAPTDQAPSLVGDCTQALRSAVKRLIVLAACWGFPAEWAQWLIQRGGLTHD